MITACKGNKYLPNNKIYLFTCTIEEKVVPLQPLSRRDLTLSRLLKMKVASGRGAVR